MAQIIGTISARLDKNNSGKILPIFSDSVNCQKHLIKVITEYVLEKEKQNILLENKSKGGEENE